MGYVLAQYDRGNNGMGLKEATGAIQELKPKLNHKQSVDQLYRNIVLAYFAAGKIKQKFLKAQTTTTDQSAITHESHLRWYVFVPGFFYYTWNNIISVCNSTGKTFAELFKHFLLGSE